MPPVFVLRRRVPTIGAALLLPLLLLRPGRAWTPSPVASSSRLRTSARTLPILAPRRTSSLEAAPDLSLSLSLSSLSSLSSLTSMSQEQGEALAGPFFGLSLFPYLAFLYFLDVPENRCPKGVTVGFATCLLFVFLTIPAAIAAKVLFGVSLADCDWLHGSAESLLTVTNLVTVVAFRQALRNAEGGNFDVGSYGPMVKLVAGLTSLAGLTALVPAVAGAGVHAPYLGGVLDLPPDAVTWGRPEPENALTVACWIIHWTSLVEFLVAMGFAWRWADAVGNPRWKGITWGLLPLHSSGITACTYHLFYNGLPFMVPLQALLTCVGNLTAAYAAYRLAVSNGWTDPRFPRLASPPSSSSSSSSSSSLTSPAAAPEPASLPGFEDLGDVLRDDGDAAFLVKLFLGCAALSYACKYGELATEFPFQGAPAAAVAIVGVPSALNALKWYRRSRDPEFEGWF